MASYNVNKDDGLNNNGRKFFNKLLRNMPSWGQNFDDRLIKNSVAIGLNQIPMTNNGDARKMYDFFSSNASSNLFNKKSISYLDVSYQQKRQKLREYSRKDEIRDFVTMISDESVVYDENTKFLIPIGLSEEFSENIKKKYLENFDSIYNRFGFSEGINAWNYFKKLLVDGYLAFEIVYDDKQREIIGFKELDTTTLVPGVDPMSAERIWIQYPESPEYRTILLDSQIIYISYSTGLEYSETSYVENLIRPYNQLKLLEQTRIMFNIVNAMSYKQFTIPVGGLSKQMAEEQIAKLIANYKDEITWDDQMGTVQINGSPHIPYSKEYWFPEGEGGTPKVEIVKQEGHNLNENDMLTWFFNALKRSSKIPFTRFDKNNGGGNVFSDQNDVSRDEVSFYNFVSRLRAIFKEILCSLSSSILDSEGKPYFHIEWLVREILKLDEETIEENDRWKKASASGTAIPPEGGGVGPGPSEFGGGANEFSPAPEASPIETPAPAETPTTPEAPAPEGGETNFDF